MRPTKTNFSLGKRKRITFFQLFFGLLTTNSYKMVTLMLLSASFHIGQVEAHSPLVTGTNCGESCFHAEILEKEKVDNCYNFKIRVNNDGDCKHGLSHLMVGIPCGNVTSASNSEGWPVELNVWDYKTKLYGLKVDEIKDFGEGNDAGSFIVEFTVCGDNDQCMQQLSCWNPKVGYKAGYCVYYETLFHDNTPEDPDLEAVITKTDLSCNGNSNGSASVEVTQGTAPYTYEWSNGATTSSIENVPAAVYEVIVRDANDNELTLSTTIEEPEGMLLEFTSTPAACNGTGDGSLNLEVTGGKAPYIYSWNNGSTSEDLTSINAGFYSVSVTDSEGCSTQGSFEVENSVELIVFANIQHATCSGVPDGSIDITVEGGVAPYTYSWSNGSIREDQSDLAGDFYVVQITDANGCFIERAYLINENNQISVNADVVNTGCVDNGTGSIDITIEGGEAPYDIIWSNDATTEDISGLIAGSYTASITDANGCTYSFTTSVAQESLIVSFDPVPPTCVGGQDGSINLTVDNGVEPYEYSWSNDATTKNLENVGSGLYSVTITDAEQCSVTKMVYLAEPLPIQIVGEVQYTACNSEDNSANIVINATGGTEPYTYSWSNGESTKDLTGVLPGSYVVTVTDVNGCQNIAIFDVTDAPESSVSCLIEMPELSPNCNSEGNFLTATVSGASNISWEVVSSDNSWSIQSGANENQISYTAGNEGSEATFLLSVTDEFGCAKTCEMTLTSCTPVDDGGDNGGGDDGDDGDDGEDQCEDCFSSQIVQVYTISNCIKYEITVTTNGNCAHDLSHYTVAIPCGEVKYFSNSRGWPMEVNALDPTTGLYGFKVDDIQNFGKTEDSFTISFKICSSNMECQSEIGNWSPEVAYKSGQCISYEDLNLGSDEEEDEEPVSVYPNPCVDYSKISYNCKETDYTVVDVCNTKGEVVSTLWKGTCYKNKNYKFLFEGRKHKKDIYIYRIRNSKKSMTGKIHNMR